MAWLDSVNKYLYEAATPIEVNLPADANEAYADYLGPIWTRLGYVDSLNVNLTEVGEEPTPLTANFSADDLGGYTDSYSVGYGFNFVDAKAVQEDSIATDFRGAISVTLSESQGIQADALGVGYGFNLTEAKAVQADEIAVDFRGALSVTLSDASDIQVDALGIGYGFKFVDAKDAFADELDDVYLRFFAALTDSPGIHADEIATDFRGAISVNLDDTIGTWGDSVSYAGQSDIPVEISDSLNAWNDVVVIDFRGAISVSLADTIDTWGDFVDRLLPINFVTSDSNEVYTDALASKLTFAVELSDSQGVHGDSVAKYLSEAAAVSITVNLYDAWRESAAVEIPVTLSDSNIAYNDSCNVILGILYRATDTRRTYPSAEAITKYFEDTKDAYTDDLRFVLGYRYRLSDAWREGVLPLSIGLSDSNEIYDDSLDVNTNDLDAKLYDSNVAYNDSVGWTYGLCYNVKEPTELVWSISNVGGGAIEGYRIYRGVVSNVYTNYYQIPNPATLSVDIRLAIPPGDWFVAVAAYNSTGISAYSNEIRIQYAEFGDSVTASTKSINFTEPKPPFDDFIAARLPYFADVGVDDFNAYTDASAARLVLRAGLSDDVLNLGDSVAFAGDVDLKPGYSDALSIPEDSLQVILTLDANLQDDQDTLSDSTNIELGEYVSLEINVDLNDGLDNWVDDVLNDVYNATDLRIPLTEDALVYADSLVGGMTIDASPSEDSLGSYADIFGWGWLIRQAALNDSIPAKNDELRILLSLAAIINLPGIDYDVVASPWLSLADDNTWKPVEYPADVDV